MRPSSSPRLAYPLYRLLSTSLCLAGLPPALAGGLVLGKTPPGMGERLGIISSQKRERLRGGPRVWVHAVSVGEVLAASAVLAALWEIRPETRVLVSTGTPAGRERAGEILGQRAACVFAPLDFIGALRPALAGVRPHVMVFMETELWPNWVMEARRAGAGVVLANGRLSPRSLKGYLRFRPFFRQALQGFSAFSMISNRDAQRILRLGAPEGRVRVAGNAKLDLLLDRADDEAGRRMAEKTGLRPGTPVLVAGSTRTGEEALVLDAFLRVRKKYPGLALVLAPRHVERTRDVVSLVRQKGLSAVLYSSLGQQRERLGGDVLVVDRIGPLMDLYSTAAVAFCGGSLVPLGGQNVLEAAAWGKPVLFGPHMEDFAEEAEMLARAGGGFVVRNAADLALGVEGFLSRPGEARRAGQSARIALSAHEGAALRHARAVSKLLPAMPSG